MDSGKSKKLIEITQAEMELLDKNQLIELSLKLQRHCASTMKMLKNSFNAQVKCNEELRAANAEIAKLQKGFEGMKGYDSVNLGKTYNINATWIDKIVFVLKQTGRPMRSSEIIEVLLANDVAFGTLSNPQKGLSTHITKALKYGRIVGKRQKGRNGYLLSLPDDSA